MIGKETVSGSWDKPSLAAGAESFRGRPVLPVILIALTFICLASGIVWSTFAGIVEVAVGEGRVIPAKKVQLVQNLEGGIIKDIRVGEGDLISRGEILVVIDPTASDAALGERQEHLASLRAGKEWISAFLNDVSPVYDDEYTARHPDLVARSMAQFRAKREELDAALSALDEQAAQKVLELDATKARLENAYPQLEIAAEQFSMFDRLRTQNAASRADVLNARARMLELQTMVDDLVNLQPSLKAGIAEISARKREVKSRFHAEMTERLNDVSVKLDALQQAVMADEDRIARTRVQSPVDGIVKILHTNTVGQIVKPGENIVEIVPIDENLLIETNIRPNDIAFIHPEQEAVIKITAYDSSIFGNLRGTVKQIAADSIVDENGHAYYRIQVQAKAGHLQKDGMKFPVIPGMVAQVDIVTGEKTIFEYITKPIHRMASTSFRER
ncbi:MAG: HlyD family type I secretion periplasmic adaptor subunit [Pseudomonadota bacterium]